MYGGLLISIVTDQVQAIATILLVTILTIYVAVTFRAPLPKPLPNDPNFGYNPWTGYVSWPLGVNDNGYSAIFSMPVSLIAATVFSEAMWQKVWASKDKKAMIGGGFLASFLVMLIVFLVGFGGWLAAWAGYVNYNTNGNLFLFQVFKSEMSTDSLPSWSHAPDMDYPPPYVSSYPDAPPGSVFTYYPYSARLKSWVGLLTLVMAVIMSESAVDSMQNGLVSCLTNHFFRDQNIFFARFMVFCINVPVMIVACRKYQVLSLFLIANMLTTCWFLPLLSGLFDWSSEFVGETGVIFSGSAAVLSTIFYSAGRWWWKAGNYFDAFDCGAWYAWFGNVSYWYEYFLVASGSSVIAMILWGTGKLLLKKVGIQGIGISDILAYIPGWKFISGEGLGFDLMDKMGLGRFNKPKEPVDSFTPPTETSHDMAIAKNIKSVDALVLKEHLSAEDVTMSGLKAEAS
jgi:SSS family solute:Na+ symporter